jgi:hypothetical protein
MASAPHKAVAVKFLEYMASDEAQKIISTTITNFRSAGKTVLSFRRWAVRTDPMNVAVYGQNQAQAQALFDRRLALTPSASLCSAISRLRKSIMRCRYFLPCGGGVANFARQSARGSAAR